MQVYNALWLEIGFVSFHLGLVWFRLIKVPSFAKTQIKIFVHNTKIQIKQFITTSITGEVLSVTRSMIITRSLHYHGF